tara:strand:+ start:1233 stop:1628 length:396 start_codon:yes stop_codon:yes gene_type:complete
MYTKENLVGILLSLPKLEINVIPDDSTRIGYRVRLRATFRGGSEMLQAIQRTLLQYDIESRYRDEEHKSRPRPILAVTGKKNLNPLCELVPDNLPDIRNEWGNFKEAVDLFDRNMQHTLTGLERIIELKSE